MSQRRLEPWKWEVQWLAIGSWQQPAERIIEVGPLKTIWEVAQELSVYYSKVIQHLKQIGKVKKPDKWVPHEVTINEKSHPFQVFSSLILCNNVPFIDQIVMYKKKWILHDNQWWPAQWLDWKEAAKHFPKPSLHQKKSLGHWRSATSLIDYSFLNPNETIISENYAQQINEMHWKLQCLQPATERAQFVPWQCLTACHKTNASKVEWIRLWSFASSAIFTWPLTNQLPLLQASWQLFAGKMFPQPAGGRKMHGFLCYRNKRTYFSLAKMCWL